MKKYILILISLTTILGYLLGFYLATPRFATLESIQENSTYIYNTINNLSTSKNLHYQVSCIGLKSNELVYVSILTYRKDDGERYINSTNIDTTFYTFKNKTLSKIQTNKNYTIYQYLSENKFISLNSWFN